MFPWFCLGCGIDTVRDPGLRLKNGTLARYLATKNAVVAERKGTPPPSPLDRGWYVDGFVTAVQRFEDSSTSAYTQGARQLVGM